jgi:hypothetical protein
MQIWYAVSTYLLISIIKKELQFEALLYSHALFGFKIKKLIGEHQ